MTSPKAKTADKLDWKGDEFLREVERRSGARVSACLQCHKCSTGCPVGPEMDVLSSQIMRLIQLGQEREVLESEAIWLCASCQACATRCPMDIDVAGVMDTLRMMAVENKVQSSDARGKRFNDAFLASVRRHGRVYELGMMIGYKMRTGDFFADADKAPQMFKKGKLSILPHGSGGAREARKVFDRANEEEKKR
jgi:heterodisulfide reductase subunit C2